MNLRKIVSGGQTGADRAALDVARELGIEHGGWVPRGRWAEDGPLAANYHVREADSPLPAVRTEFNVRDSDATLIISHGPLVGGSAVTLAAAENLGRPVLQIDLLQSNEQAAARTIIQWLEATGAKVLNVAGPRASNDPLVYDAVSRILRHTITESSADSGSGSAGT